MTFPYRTICAALICAAALPTVTRAAEPAKLPVREVTVFKDGYAFVVREGKLPVSPTGTATLDELPVPVLGTFWAYSVDKSVTVRAVTAKRVDTQTVRDAASVRELLAANVGANVVIRDGFGSAAQIITGKVLSVRGENPQVRGESIVLLQTDTGVRAVPIPSNVEITLAAGKPKLTVTDAGSRPQLSLALSGANGSANLGVMYVQRGLRWIPGYKVVIDDKTNTARISLQATLVNDLTDMDNVTANLVIGVPKWDFEGMVDPIALQETAAQVGQYFRKDSGNRFSNALMSQSGAMSSDPSAFVAQSVKTNAPTVTGSESKEDFFVFTLKNVSLKRGERMVLPVAEFSLAYKDVYKLELAPTPPPDWGRAYMSGSANQLPAELASLLSAPKVRHVLRFKNTSPFPITTAPALLMSGERVLSQGTFLYTAKGAETDLPLSTASNISLTRNDKETGRTPDAKKWNGYSFEQVDLAGTITLTNYGTKPAALEVTRYVLGTVTETSEGGTADTLDLFGGSDTIPGWWNSYQLPNDLGRFNGLGRATWKVTAPVGKPVNLSYSWRYLWR